MSEDDPRHGSYAGAVAHWLSGGRPCEPCAVAEMRYRKRRNLRHLHGDPPTIPAIGTLRRIQALHALGHTGPQIAADAGLSVHAMRSIAYHDCTNVRTATATKIHDAYERLCMTRPEGHYANRARSIAARRGWVPPLAWDDIDDPDEAPSGWTYTGPMWQARGDILAELDARGDGITAACLALHVTRDAIERWCQRHEERDLYSRLVDREATRYWVNQYREGGVA